MMRDEGRTRIADRGDYGPGQAQNRKAGVDLPHSIFPVEVFGFRGTFRRSHHPRCPGRSLAARGRWRHLCSALQSSHTLRFSVSTSESVRDETMPMNAPATVSPPDARDRCGRPT